MTERSENPRRTPAGPDPSLLPFPYQCLDRQGNIREVNAAWKDRLGFDAGTVRGEWFGEYIAPTDRGRFDQVFETIVEDQSTSPLELTLVDADGQSVTVAMAVAIERDDEGSFVRAHCQFTDVSRPKESIGKARSRTDSEAGFSDTEQRMKLAVEGANVGIWEWDMVADEVFRDELLANMLGYTPEEMGDHLDDWERLVHPEGEQRHNEALAEHIAEDTEFYQCDYRMKTKSGDWKWVRTMGKVVERDDDGTPLRSVGIHLDIDEQKRNQLKLARRTEQLEALNRVVRHDIRNDMNVLHMWAQELADQVDETGEKAVEQILHASRHIIELTDVAREFIESLGMDEDVDLKPIPLDEQLRNELDKQRETYPDAHFEVVDDLPSVTVRANEMLSSVFRNLLVNAVEHNDADTPVVTVSMALHDDTVEITIADNGPGIPDALRDEIFGKGTNGLDGGTGIGLYLVERLVDGYGGDVRIADGQRHPATGSQSLADDTASGAVFVIELSLGET
ncbi:sensor histidine kinase [Halorhabdus salina]|uniref:sensor histidine kinase n=1 Tax=Halorhabdus salina TaxID=2750670 RepID=UPI0015EF9217|nr:PAS domain-containing sensor histidine kinase [Halorhabdus salina]